MAQQINLFSPLFLKKRKHFSAVTMLQALGVLLVAILAFYGYAVYEVRKLQRASVESSAALKTQTELVAQMTREFSPQGRSRLLEEEITRLETTIRQREELLSLLRTGGLGNTAGFSRYLLALARQTTPGVWLTGLTVGGDEGSLLLNGRAQHADLVPAYIRALNREEVMRGRRVSELRLTSREQRPATTAAPGEGPVAGGGAASTPASSAAARPVAPLRYVEFSLTAMREGGK